MRVQNGIQPKRHTGLSLGGLRMRRSHHSPGCMTLMAHPCEIILRLQPNANAYLKFGALSFYRAFIIPARLIESLATWLNSFSSPFSLPRVGLIINWIKANHMVGFSMLSLPISISHQVQVCGPKGPPWITKTLLTFRNLQGFSGYLLGTWGKGQPNSIWCRDWD